VSPTVEVPFSLIKFPKVFPPSVLVLITGLSAPVSFVHHVTATLFPAAFIFTLLRITDIFGFVLGGLSTIAFENVFPLPEEGWGELLGKDRAAGQVLGVTKGQRPKETKSLLRLLQFRDLPLSINIRVSI
jgi:hypothetical protein